MLGHFWRLSSGISDICTPPPTVTMDGSICLTRYAAFIASYMYEVEMADMPTTSGLNERISASSATQGSSCTVQSITRISKSFSIYAESAVNDGDGIRPRKNLNISCGGSTKSTRITNSYPAVLPHCG